MESDADAFARLAHDLYDQANLEKTVEKIVESAVTVVGCDYAGLLMTSKGNQFVAINASDPAAEKAGLPGLTPHELPHEPQPVWTRGR